MRKYLAATVLGAMLIAGQAAANDNGVLTIGDRISAQSGAAEGMEGNNGLVYFAITAAAIAGIVSWLILSGNTNGKPMSA